MIITKVIFESFLNCQYKAYRILKGDSGDKSEYEIMQGKIGSDYATDATIKLFAKYNADSEISHIQETTLTDGHKIMHQKYINHHELSSCDCILERAAGESALVPFHYLPVLFVPKEKLAKDDKLAVAFDGLILGDLQGRSPESGKIIYGRDFKTIRIKIGHQKEKVKVIISKIKKICNEKIPPALFLNRHCQICEFKDSCRARAIEKDDLSLLAGISMREIEAQNKKGIFTVTQYSYSFRARREFIKSYPFNLKALAIREKKIYVYGKPEMQTANVQIYLDVEGDPDRDFYYLVGVIIIQNSTEKHYTFWAENQDQEDEIFFQFLSIMKDYSEFKIYHYGSYETKFLQKMRKNVNRKDERIFDTITKSSVNVLSIIYPKNPKNFGESIRKKRMDLGLTMKDVAKKVGVSETIVYNWEIKNRTPYRKTEEKLKEILALKEEIPV